MINSKRSSLTSYGIMTSVAITVLVILYTGELARRLIEKEFFPIVAYKAKVLSHDSKEAIIHISGHKLRDCEVIKGSLQTYAVKDGVYFDIQEERVTGDSSSRPVGLVDLGAWRVYPILGAQRVVMTITHDCDGHKIKSEIANVILEKKDGF